MYLKYIRFENVLFKGEEKNHCKNRSLLGVSCLREVQLEQRPIGSVLFKGGGTVRTEVIEQRCLFKGGVQ